MRALAFKLLGDFQDAEDVLQVAWGMALARRPGDHLNLPGWLGPRENASFKLLFAAQVATVGDRDVQASEAATE